MTICVATKILLNFLRNKYEEASDIIGTLDSDLGVFQFYHSYSGETWSAVVHFKNGFSCVIAAGYDYQNIIWFLKPTIEGSV